MNFAPEPRPKPFARTSQRFSLEQVYGAITFYLGHRSETAAYLAEQEAMWEERERTVKPTSPDLQRRLEEARKRTLTSQM